MRKFFTIGCLKIFLLLISSSFSACLQTYQVSDVKTVYYGFEANAYNFIFHAVSLNPLMKKLLALKAGISSQVHIVIIGDSHQQPDFFATPIRDYLQNKFGNAGRGLVIPMKVSGTNEAFNYQTSSLSPWLGKRCSKMNISIPIGVAGISLQTQQPNADFFVRLKHPRPINNFFNQIQIFANVSGSNYQCEVRSEWEELLAQTTLTPNSDNLVNLKRPVNNVKFYFKSLNPNISSTLTVQGLIFKKANSGILLSVIAANGAQAFHYNKAENFWSQLQSLTPDLVIVALGTNEALRPRFSSSEIQKDYMIFYQNLKIILPKTPVLFITPANSYSNKKPNERIKMVADIFRDLSKKTSEPLWDMNQITGDSQNWKLKGLLRPDLIHFSKEAYQYQGNLFLAAFIRAYNDYITH